jgi:ABC-type lipoprotein release transport system permease subunit
MIKDAIFNLTGHIKLFAPAYRDDPVIEHSFTEPQPNLLQALNASDVARWVTRVRVPGVVSSERESAGIALVGVDPEKEKGVSVAGLEVVAGRALSSESENGVVLGKKLVEKLRTELGKRVVFTTRDIKGEIADRGFRIVGVFDAELESTETSYAFFGIQTLQKMLLAEGRFTEISVFARDREKVDSVQGMISREAQQFEVKGWLELEPLIDAMTKMQDGLLLLWFSVVIVCVSFGLVNTIFMSVFERARELGVMQALGMGQMLVVMQIFVESVALIVVGCLFGTAAGFFGSQMLSDGIDISRFARGAGHAGIGSTIYPSLHAGDITMIIVLMILIGGIGSLYPAWTTARQKPMELIARL